MTHPSIEDCWAVLAAYSPSRGRRPAQGWWGRTSVSIADVVAWPVILGVWAGVAWCLGWVLKMLIGGE